MVGLKVESLVVYWVGHLDGSKVVNLVAMMAEKTVGW